MKKKTDSRSGVWRKPTPQEKKRHLAAYENTFGKVGRPSMDAKLKRVAISIKLDPQVLAKFKEKAKKTGRPYQSLINEALKKAA